MKAWIKIGIISSICINLLFGAMPALNGFAIDEKEEKKVEEKLENREAQEEKPTKDAKGRPILGDGETGILIDASSGAVLYEIESQKKMYPASTTKIMTALVALDAISSGEVTLETVVEVTEDMLKDLDPDSSNMELKVGEIMPLERLLQGLMIPSGNDAAMAISYLIAGNDIAFVDRMNAKAEQLGLKNTHFMNPHGLHHENHYTTAEDMARMAKAAMENDIFRNIVDIAHIKMPPTNKTEKQRYYINTNGLISTMRYTDYYYPKSTGIKTGYTSQAGNCLVASARDNGFELISVVFNGKDTKASHGDSIRLLNYGFEAFEMLTPISKDKILGEIRVKQGRSKDSVTLSAQDRVSVVAPKGTKADELELRLNLPDALYAPIAKGQVAGTVSVMYGDQELGIGNLCTDLEVKRSFFWPILALGEWLWGILIFRVLFYALMVALALFLLVFGLRSYNEIKRVKNLKKRKQKDSIRK